MPGTTREAEKLTLAYVTVTHPALPVSVAPLVTRSRRRKTQTLPPRRGQSLLGRLSGYLQYDVMSTTEHSG